VVRWHLGGAGRVAEPPWRVRQRLRRQRKSCRDANKQQAVVGHGDTL
jgi:hypothetical protein